MRVVLYIDLWEGGTFWAYHTRIKWFKANWWLSHEGCHAMVDNVPEPYQSLD